jgi:hypothetical protein
MKIGKVNELSSFEALFDKLVTVPHGEIKAKLEEEKARKKRKKSKKSSASREGA